MQKIREFLESDTGKYAGFAVIAIGALAIFLSLRSSFGPSAAEKLSTDRVFICAKTGKTFNYTLKRGDIVPVESPHSGEKTGYPAEMCGWTTDGAVRSEPFPVLLNINKGSTDPTFCPDCGRLVVHNNPPASADRKPPPTRSEYDARKRAPRSRNQEPDADR